MSDPGDDHSQTQQAFSDITQKLDSLDRLRNKAWSRDCSTEGDTPLSVKGSSWWQLCTSVHNADQRHRLL